jgi:hypothetical protein
VLARPQRSIHHRVRAKIIQSRRYFTMDRLKLLLAERPQANFNILPRDALLPRLVMDGASKQASPFAGKCLAHSLTHLPIFDVHIDIHSHQHSAQRTRTTRRESKKKTKSVIHIRHAGLVWEKIPAA